jgi:DNA-binding HxlR family transcriptional regulator
MNKIMTSYREVRSQVDKLTLEEQLQLLEDLRIIVRRDSKNKSQRSIMKLEGMGKDIWQGIDAQKYVERERISWDG